MKQLKAHGGNGAMSGTPITDKEEREREFVQFYNTHIDKVLKHLWRRTGADSATLEDLAQNIFVDFWLKVPSFSNSEGVVKLLYGFARKVIAEYHRNGARDKKQLVDEPEYGEVASDRHVESQFDNDELEQNVQQAIDGLPDDLRVIVRGKWDGKKDEEIAQEMQIPLGTVKSRAHTARKMLKVKLKNDH